MSASGTGRDRCGGSGLLTDRFLARARSPGVDLGWYLVMPDPPPPPVGLWSKPVGVSGRRGAEQLLSQCVLGLVRGSLLV